MAESTQERLQEYGRKLNVLFLGGRNSGRSVMAAAMLRSKGLEQIEVFSAGVQPGHLDARTTQVMSEIGVDVSAHVPRAVDALRSQRFDLVVTVCNDARDFRAKILDVDVVGQEAVECPAGKIPLLVGAPLHLDWYLADPAAAEGTEEEALELYREVRDRLRAYVDPLADHGYLRAFSSQREAQELLIDSLDEGVMAHDDCGHIYLFNRAAERITGYKREEVLGRHCHSTFEPDGLCGSVCPIHQGLPHSEGAKPEYPVHFINRAGEDRRLKMVVKPVFDGPGHSKGVVATMRDVTEVSELRFKLKERHSFRGMVGNALAMQEVFETIRQVSASDYPVLVTGESGTGKELVSNAIHLESRRSGGPFVAINCGALPENILESELFGHVKGAFTGAIRNKKGRFELAHHGTLFLDEVGELTPGFQVKLLRVLEQKRFEQVGSEQPVHVDVRIIAATNRDLREMVRRGQFREDLFYRLSVVPIALPPLRERREDIPALVDKVLTDIRRDTKKTIERVSDQALDLLVAHTWPGNVRELINALQAAAVRCDGEEIQDSQLPAEIRNPSLLRLEHGDSGGESQVGSRRRRVKLDRAKVDQALAAAGGSKVEAARLLKVGRATLYRYLNKNQML